MVKTREYCLIGSFPFSNNDAPTTAWLAVLLLLVLASRDQIRAQDAINRHALDGAIEDLYVRQAHLSEGAVAQHGLFKGDRLLSRLFAVLVWGRTNMLEASASQIGRGKV